MWEYLGPLGNCIYSQDVGAGFWEAFSSGTEPSVPSRLNLTAEKYSCNDNEMESCRDFQSGMMFAHSTESPGEEKLMSCVPESPVSESALPVVVADLSIPMFTLHFSGLLAMFDPKRFSWKIPQCSLFEDSDHFSGTWPQWGVLQNGVCYALIMRDYHIIEPEFGWLPTPSGTSNHGKNHVAGSIQEWGGSWNSLRGTATGKRKSQELEELLLGWPVGWSDLTPLGMASSSSG